jgi:hypothetical protein
MLGFWRWAGPTVLLVGALAAFMALDRTTLHWYVPESTGSAVRNGDLTPAPSAAVTVSPTVAPQFTEFEVDALALQWVTEMFPTIGGYDCATAELNDLQSRWTTVCTESKVEGTVESAYPRKVMAVAVDAITGATTDLETAATAATKTPMNTATATATKTPMNTATATATKTPQ